MEKPELAIIAVSVASFAVVALLNLYFFNTMILYAVASMFLIFPYLAYRSIIAGRVRALEEAFTTLLLDLGSIMETRISLMQAMSSIYERDYGELTEYVRQIHKDISWGVPFFDAFVKMGKKTKSELVNRSISVVMGTFVSGGDLKKIFSAIGTHTKEIMNIRETIKGRVNVIIITCYIIFFCLLFSMFLVRNNFVSSFASFGTVSQSLVEEFDDISLHLMLVESVFAGLITGQMAENSIFSGVKHSLILVSISLIVFGVLG